MSKFSQYLDSLIKRNKESITSLARNSGVERTSIHKALAGERVLSYTSAQKLTEYLRLSPQETRIFLSISICSFREKKTLSRVSRSSGF